MPTTSSSPTHFEGERVVGESKLSKLMAEQVAGLRNWAKGRA